MHVPKPFHLEWTKGLHSGCEAPSWSPRLRYHGDTFEIYPRNGGLDGDLKNMQMPINWNSPPTTGVDLNSRFLYPHVHLLPTGDWYLQQRK